MYVFSNFFYASLVSVLILLSGNAAATTYRNAVICHDCSFSEAETLIKQRAAPALECVSSDPNQYIGIDNQMCRSSPTQSVVINATTQEVFGFTVSHLNQGGTPRTMTTIAESFIVPASAKKLAVDGLNYFAEIQNAMTVSASALSRPLSATPVTYSAASTDSCANDGDAKAMKAALDEQQIATLQRDVNNHFNDNFTPSENNFLNARFNGLSFDIARDGIGISGTWEHIPSAKSLVHYFPQSDNRVAAKVTYLLSWRDGIYVKVHDEQTYIGGYRLSSLKANSGQRMLLSACVAEVLAELYGDNLSVDAPSGGGGSTGGGGTGDGGGGISAPGIGSGSGSSVSECEVHLYDRTGKEIMNFMIPC